MFSLKKVLVVCLLISSVYGEDVMPKALVQKAGNVMNAFVKNMQEHTYKESAKMIVPLMHKSLLSSDQKSLDDDTYRYSFKKAHMNAKNYSYPIVITRIQKLRTTEIGYGATHEKGVEYKLWIAKNKSSQGLPAPLVVFFNEGSQDAKLSYVGSL